MTLTYAGIQTYCETRFTPYTLTNTQCSRKKVFAKPITPKLQEHLKPTEQAYPSGSGVGTKSAFLQTTGAPHLACYLGTGGITPAPEYKPTHVVVRKARPHNHDPLIP